MKIELGGGFNPKGDGFINMDRTPNADFIIDFETDKFPFPDDSVTDVYSAHCLEHVAALHVCMNEVLRVCMIGAKVELHFPHWLHEMANCFDHKHVISERQVKLWCEQSRYDFPDSPKRFDLIRPPHYQPDEDFYHLRAGFPQLRDDQVLKFIPNCCWEVHYFMEVVLKDQPLSPIIRK